MDRMGDLLVAVWAPAWAPTWCPTPMAPLLLHRHQGWARDDLGRVAGLPEGTPISEPVIARTLLASPHAPFKILAAFTSLGLRNYLESLQVAVTGSLANSDSCPVTDGSPFKGEGVCCKHGSSADKQDRQNWGGRQRDRVAKNHKST